MTLLDIEQMREAGEEVRVINNDVNERLKRRWMWFIHEKVCTLDLALELQD